MIVKNNRDGLTVIPLKNKEGKVLASRISNLVLYPGYTAIDDGIWEIIEDSAKLLVESEQLQLVTKEEKSLDEDGNKVKKQVGVPFNKLPVNKAEEIIKNTNNMESINKWLEIETRDSVRITLKNRLDNIKEYVYKQSNEEEE